MILDLSKHDRHFRSISASILTIVGPATFVTSGSYQHPFLDPMIVGLRNTIVTCLVWLFAINRTTIPRIYSCSELVCAIVDLGIVGLSVMCAHCGHNLFICVKLKT